MSDYKAKPGQEDRHGEMTGAISINMVLCMPWVCAWSVFVGPLFFESVWPTAIIALVMAIALPIACMPLSRRIWARISKYMDESQF
jgi:hypothetical protein